MTTRPKKEFLFINKSADSINLSRSKGPEKSSIHRHAGAKHHRYAKQSSTPLPFRSGHATVSKFRLQKSCSVVDIEDRRMREAPSGNVALCQSPSSEPHLTHQEFRSFHFFFKRTAVEWTGWSDRLFWNTLLYQMCSVQPSLRHAVIAVGTLHEINVHGDADGAEAGRIFSLQQSNKTITSIIDKGATIPLPVLLISCLLFALLQTVQEDHTIGARAIGTIRTLKSGLMLVDGWEQQRQQQQQQQRGVRTSELSKADDEFIFYQVEPIFEMYRSRICAVNDLPCALNASLQRYCSSVSRPRIPSVFSTLLEARDSLAEILDWACSVCKEWTVENSLPTEVHDASHRWLLTLRMSERNTVCDPDTSHSMSLLKAAHKASFIILRTRAANKETAFDEYNDDFAEIVSLYRNSAKPRAPAHTTFGSEGGSIAILTMVATRCRDPQTRRNALSLLNEDDKMEGIVSSHTGGPISTALMAVEEGDSQPQSCHEIPESQRVRVHSISFYGQEQLIRVQYLRSPYDSVGASGEVWLGMLSDSPQFQPVSPPQGGSEGCPDLVFGRAKVAFLTAKTPQEYRTIEQGRFFFPIPKC